MADECGKRAEKLSAAIKEIGDATDAEVIKASNELGYAVDDLSSIRSLSQKAEERRHGEGLPPALRKSNPE